MKNGDRITCEIKELDRERLMVKPPYAADSIAVDWNQVDRIESDQLFQVIMTDGTRLYGAIRQEADDSPGPDEQPFIVETDDQADVYEHQEVTSIEQFGGSFWEKIDFGVDFGYSFLKSNSETQSSLNARLERLSRRNHVEATTSSYLTRRNDDANNNRHNGRVTYLRLASNNWFYGSLLDFLQSDQQQLDLRTTFGGLVGKRLVSGTRWRWNLFGGGVLNRETFTNQSARDNAEVIAATTVSWYQFDSTEFRTNVQFFPSLSEAGRYRIDFDTSAYIDVWGDLYLRVTLFDNFDSRPPIDAPKNDFGVSTTVGWEF